MAKILVTGIAGFTGRYVAQALEARGHEVIGVAHEGNRALEHDFPNSWRMYTADLEDHKGLTNVIEDIKPDRVVHLAAISFVGHSDVNAFYTTNLIGTVNLLNALSQLEKPVERILLASSANIYGNRRGGQISEDTPPSPSNHYGVSKLAMENVGRIMGANLPIIMTRPFNYTGLGQSLDFVIPKLVDHARRRVEQIELGNIDVSRDFSDVRTVAEVYSRLLDTEQAVGKTFNICSGRSYALRQVITMVEQIAGISFEIKVNPAFVRSDEIMELYGNPDRLHSIIGPVTGPDLRETLRWMLEGQS